MRKRLFLVGIFLLCIVLPFGATAFASPYSQLVAFGDSLSDNGPADGYGLAVASNGPVWVDYLATSLGVGLLDMAYCGAQSNYHPDAVGLGYSPETFGFLWQIDQYVNTVSSGTADSDALYSVWIGGNDLLNMADPPNIVIGNAVTNIALGINNLVVAGAENILLMNMPNLGTTPLMNGQNSWPDNSDTGEALAEAFNQALDLAIDTYRSDINLFEVDVFTMMDQLITDGYFDNYTNMLKYSPPTTDSYMFWDEIHPTTYAHSLIAEVAYNEVAPVPEPATMLLFGSGLVGLFGLRRKFKKG